MREILFRGKLRENAVHEHEIEVLKKLIAELKKELAEREAAPGWISVEERLPEESGYYLAYDCRGNLFVCLYQANGLWDSSSVDYWMPIPEPPKKVKTYKDVFIEAFPKATITAMGRPAVCRNNIFGEGIGCKDVRCEDCWKQPYPEEEGGRNEGEDRTVLQVVQG